jgi:hypothetical protein
MRNSKRCVSARRLCVVTSTDDSGCTCRTAKRGHRFDVQRHPPERSWAHHDHPAASRVFMAADTEPIAHWGAGLINSCQRDVTETE